MDQATLLVHRDTQAFRDGAAPILDEDAHGPRIRVLVRESSRAGPSIHRFRTRTWTGLPLRMWRHHEASDEEITAIRLPRRPYATGTVSRLPALPTW